MLHVAVNKRVSKHPVQQDVPGQVQDPVGHLVDPLGSAGGREHVEADVLGIRRDKSLTRYATLKKATLLKFMILFT